MKKHNAIHDNTKYTIHRNTFIRKIYEFRGQRKMQNYLFRERDWKSLAQWVAGPSSIYIMRLRWRLAFWSQQSFPIPVLHPLLMSRLQKLRSRVPRRITIQLSNATPTKTEGSAPILKHSCSEHLHSYSQKVETTQGSIHRRMQRDQVVYLDTAISFSYKQEWSTATLGWTLKTYGKWREKVTKTTPCMVLLIRNVWKK